MYLPLTVLYFINKQMDDCVNYFCTQVISDVSHFLPSTPSPALPKHGWGRKDPRFSPEFQEKLRERGHIVVEDCIKAGVQGIFVKDGKIQATSDFRKGGEAAGY